MITERLAAVSALLVAATLAGAEPQEIPTSPQGVRPLLIGSRAPMGVLADATGADVDLGQVLAGNPTVVVFYRAHW